MKKLIFFFAKISTRTMINISYFLSFLCIFLVGPAERVGGLWQLIVFSLIPFFWGTAGIPMIIRKEAQPFFETNGWAVVLGIVHLVLGWGSSFGLLTYNLLRAFPAK